MHILPPDFTPKKDLSYEYLSSLIKESQVLLLPLFEYYHVRMTIVHSDGCMRFITH
jgi:hypothetical protein